MAVMVRVVDRGETVAGIAKALGRSPTTVSTLLARARSKLGANTNVQAAVFFDRARRGVHESGVRG
jgi:DNA-binding NarL/FixJ family response regulator